MCREITFLNVSVLDTLKIVQLMDAPIGIQQDAHEYLHRVLDSVSIDNG